jgi:hypothetical protein
VGGRRLERELFNRYVIIIIGFFGEFGDNHAGHQKVTQALAHDRSDNYSSVPRPERRVFKFEKKLKKGCDSFEKKMSFLH